MKAFNVLRNVIVASNKTVNKTKPLNLSRLQTCKQKFSIWLLISKKIEGPYSLTGSPACRLEKTSSESYIMCGAFSVRQGEKCAFYIEDT